MKPGPRWSNQLRLVRGGTKRMGIRRVTSWVSDQFIGRVSGWVADWVTNLFSNRVADRVGRWVTKSGYVEKK
jgi:hypothetical protein